MFVIIAVATDARVASGLTGVAIGLTVAMDALMGGPLTGRIEESGPDHWTGTGRSGVDDSLIYWLGPIIGGVAAARTYEFLRTDPTPAESSA